VQNLVGIDLAVTDLRMPEKHGLCGFFINISVYLSLCPFLPRGYRSPFWAILTLNGSNDVISPPLVPFGGHINIAHY